MLSDRLKTHGYNGNLSSIFANTERRIRSAKRGQIMGVVSAFWRNVIGYLHVKTFSLVEIQCQLVQVCGVFVMSRNQMHSVAAQDTLKIGDPRDSRVHCRCHLLSTLHALCDIARQLGILLACARPTGIHGVVGMLCAKQSHKTTKLLVWVPPSCI